MPNGRIAVAGRVSDAEAGFGIRTQSQNAGWVALLEVNGDSSLSKRIANGAVVSMSAVDKNKSGFAVLGYSEEISGAGVVHKPWLVGMNMDGALTMASALNTTVHPNSVSQSDDGYLLVGTWNDQSVDAHSKDDGWLCALGRQGDVRWARKIFSSNPDSLKLAIQIPGNRLLLGGYEERDLQVHPVLLDLPMDGAAEFISASGYSQMIDDSPRASMRLIDSYQPLKARDIVGVTRIPVPLRFKEIENAVVERIGRY